MDFITDLPILDGYDTILVVIDRLTKMSHFIPCNKNLDARQFAILFFKEIIRLHGTSAKKISLHVYDTLLPEGSGMVSDPYTSCPA